jgi:hypothetical protein
MIEINVESMEWKKILIQASHIFNYNILYVCEVIMLVNIHVT